MASAHEPSSKKLSPHCVIVERVDELSSQLELLGGNCVMVGRAKVGEFVGDAPHRAGLVCSADALVGSGREVGVVPEVRVAGLDLVAGSAEPLAAVLTEGFEHLVPGDAISARSGLDEGSVDQTPHCGLGFGCGSTGDG